MGVSSLNPPPLLKVSGKNVFFKQCYCDTPQKNTHTHTMQKLKKNIIYLNDPEFCKNYLVFSTNNLPVKYKCINTDEAYYTRTIYSYSITG